MLGVSPGGRTLRWNWARLRACVWGPESTVGSLPMVLELSGSRVAGTAVRPLARALMSRSSSSVFIGEHYRHDRLVVVAGACDELEPHSSASVAAGPWHSLDLVVEHPSVPGVRVCDDRDPRHVEDVPESTRGALSVQRPGFLVSRSVHSAQSTQTVRVSATGHFSPASRAVLLTSTSTPSAMACARVYWWITGPKIDSIDSSACSAAQAENSSLSCGGLGVRSWAGTGLDSRCGRRTAGFGQLEQTCLFFVHSRPPVYGFGCGVLQDSSRGFRLRRWVPAGSGAGAFWRRSAAPTAV